MIASDALRNARSRRYRTRHGVHQFRGYVYRYSVNGEPPGKPVPLLDWCLSLLPVGCDTILDPFMGSGTTGVACVRAGKRFVGIEREAPYFEAACRRIADARRQLRLLDGG